MTNRRGLELRGAASADAPGLSELFHAAGYPITPQALSGRLEAIRQSPGAALLAAEWGPPSGLVVLHWYPVLDADQLTAQISTLLVAPDDRRRGIGRLLVKAAAQAARLAGCGALQLLAPPGQPVLAEFCRATGFADSGGCFLRPLRKNVTRG